MTESKCLVDLQKALDKFPHFDIETVIMTPGYCRDAYEHRIEKLRELFSAFQKDYDGMVHVDRK